MTSSRAVTFEAVKLLARPLVDEFVPPLLLGLIDATSNAMSTDVAIGACADGTTQDNPESTTAAEIRDIADKSRRRDAGPVRLDSRFRFIALIIC